MLGIAKRLVVICMGMTLMTTCYVDSEYDNSLELNKENVTFVELSVSSGCKKVIVEYPTINGIKNFSSEIVPVVKVSGSKDLCPITTAIISFASPVTTHINIFDESGLPLVRNMLIRGSDIEETPHSTFILLEDAVNEYITTDNTFTFYHSSGVVMFDDSWPASYDGDFSDVVVDYDLEAKTVDASLAPNETWRECLKVVMHLRTVGGMFPRSVGLMLEGLNTKFIDTYDAKLTLGNWNKNIPSNSLTYSVDISGTHPIITLNNLDWCWGADAVSTTYVNSKTGETQFFNPKGKKDIYYNVTKGAINKGGDLFTLTVTFKGKNRAKLSASDGNLMLQNLISSVINTETQNFFISAVNGVTPNTEIHLKGYRPTPGYLNYNSNLAHYMAMAMNTSTTYASASGFIWGFKVPVLTKHVWEGESFYEAYPEYSGWVLSNGLTNTDWYTHPNKSKISEWW